MTLEESIAENLVKIDVILSAQETPLRMRPFSAATIFVEHCIVEISGDVKTDYAVKPWFAIIYHHIDQWYRDHYGAAFNAKTDSIAIGLVLVRDIPVEIQVPLTTSRVEVPGETAWIKFPIEVDPDEAPLSWLVSPPNLVRLSDGEHAQLTSDATSVAKALRSIKVNFMGIEPADETVNGLLEGVMPELETAARNVLRNDAHGHGGALWALQMAVERTLKAFSQHKSGTFRKIHNLFELFDDVASHGVKVDRVLLKKLPGDKEVMNDRYGLGSTPSLREVVEAYKAALSIVGCFSHDFRRKVNVGGASFLIGKAPWTTLPSAPSKSAPEDGPP
jgi:hypothetical protein